MDSLLFFLLIIVAIGAAPFLLIRLVVFLTSAEKENLINQAVEVAKQEAPSPETDSSVSETMSQSTSSRRPGFLLLIFLIRSVGGLALLLFGLPLLFLFPFMFDDPTEKAQLFRLLVLPMVFVYPIAFFVTASTHKKYIAEGNHRKAVRHASIPLVLMALIALVSWVFKAL